VPVIGSSRAFTMLSHWDKQNSLQYTHFVLLHCTVKKKYLKHVRTSRRPSFALDQSQDGVADIALVTWCGLTAERALPAPAAR